MELYRNEAMYDSLIAGLAQYSELRSPRLKVRDAEKGGTDWYKSESLLGMMLYIDNFAGNLQGVREKIDYLNKANVNYIHLMPFLDTVPERSDGGYAVADFRKVRPDLGTMEDLEALTAACHEKGMNICMDFVMNHTSEDHEWAKRARAGEGKYMSRYFFYADPSVPAAYEKTVPQVFPTTAPGNFTWLPDAEHYVMTTFYPYQWDLNYANPVVFNEMMYNFLYLANRGVDVVRVDATPYIWKEIGTSCRNLPQVHTIMRMMRLIGEIVCPSVILLGEVVMAPELVAPYFGTVEKPECHLLYNVTTMATTWHTVATKDVRLLRQQLDIVAKLLNKFLGMELGKAMSAAGMLVALCSALCYDKKTVVLSVLGTYFGGIVLDYFIFGIDIKRKVCILSPKYEEITQFILHELHSGASHYDLYGAYDGSVRREIVTIVDKQEYRKLMDYVHKTDPKAFVTVYSVNEIRYQPKK